MTLIVILCTEHLGALQNAVVILLVPTCVARIPVVQYPPGYCIFANVAKIIYSATCNATDGVLWNSMLYDQLSSGENTRMKEKEGYEEPDQYAVTVNSQQD